MKTLRFRSPQIALLLAFGLAALPGCSSTDTAPQQDSNDRTARVGRKTAAAKPAEEDDEVKNRPPRVGMTKSQVRARYGNPTHTIATAAGETWSYSGASWRTAIPFYGETQRMKTYSIQFGGDGRVRDFTWSELASANEQIAQKFRN